MLKAYRGPNDSDGGQAFIHQVDSVTDVSDPLLYPDVCRNFEAFDALPEAVYLIDVANASILRANQTACDELQMTLAEVCQHTVFSLQRDVLDLSHWQKIIAAIRQDSPFVFVGRHVRKDGSEFAVEVMSRFVCWQGVEYLLSIERDLSRRQAVEDELREREALLAYALNEATDGMWDWNIASGDVFFSPQLKRILGYGPYEMPPVVDTWKNNIHPDDVEIVMTAMNSHLEGRTTRYEAEYRLANRSGQYIWVKDRGRVCQSDGQGQPVRVVGMVHNIDVHKQLEQRLRDLATIDELTELMNRRAGYSAFEQVLKLASRHKAPFCVALMDLDFFKQVNDRYGHQVGDKVLKMAADCFYQRVRSSDVLMRWGGEEFLLVMPHTELEDARTLCEALRQQLAQSLVVHNGEDISVTVSIGVTTLTAHNDSIKKLVKEADTALYRAKSLGKDRVVSF